MPENELTPKKSAREALLARAREKYPERKFADLDSQESMDDVADLDEALEEMLSDYSTERAAFNESNGKLRQLLIDDPYAGDFLQRWIETKDPRIALVETFGDELGISEEAQEQFRGELESWRERKKENQKLEEEAQENWQNSLAELDSWGDAKGLSLDEKRDIMVRLLTIAANGMVNKFSAEDFDLALNAFRHDSDVEVARREGEVQGRNEKITASRRDRETSALMPPSASGGQGGRTKERIPEAKSPWAGLK